MAFSLQSITSESLPKLPQRSADSNKGTYGKVLIVAGSKGMTGAAILCGSSALRAGVGLVRVAVPDEILSVVAGGNPCYTTIPLADNKGSLSEDALQVLLTEGENNDVFAIGPGLGQSEGISQLLSQLLPQISVPVVLDADGLNAFAGKGNQLSSRKNPLVITPHPGEFARLTGKTIPEIQQNRTETAAQFARDNNLLVVLKGHETVVTDGQLLYVNPTGNPGMATAGTGDVLTGIIAALIAQGMDPFPAAQLGVYLHGLAGDLAKEEIGEVSLIATDLMNYLSMAFRRM